MLSQAESSKIKELTGCIKPCQYKKYTFIGERNPSAFTGSKYRFFSLWAVSEKTKVGTEKLIYPLSNLIAEFGGILGLFLGFSFISLWDNIHLLKCVCKIVKRFIESPKSCISDVKVSTKLLGTGWEFSYEIDMDGAMFKVKEGTMTGKYSTTI